MPFASETVTSLGSSPSTPPATRWVIERTWLLPSLVPGCSSSSTDAVGLSCSVANTSFFGSARCTTAARTPVIACRVLLISPSSARR